MTRKLKLYPPLKKLGFDRCGLHAFPSWQCNNHGSKASSDCHSAESLAASAKASCDPAVFHRVGLVRCSRRSVARRGHLSLVFLGERG